MLGLHLQESGQGERRWLVVDYLVVNLAEQDGVAIALQVGAMAIPSAGPISRLGDDVRLVAHN
jgi:hypothetical protein